MRRTRQIQKLDAVIGKVFGVREFELDGSSMEERTWKSSQSFENYPDRAWLLLGLFLFQ